MNQFSEHVKFQFPDERSRIRHLLDSIVTTDEPLLAATSNLGLEDKDMIYDFEKDSAHFFMRGPVAKCKSLSNNANNDDLDHASK